MQLRIQEKIHWWIFRQDHVFEKDQKKKKHTKTRQTKNSCEKLAEMKQTVRSEREKVGRTSKG